MQTVIGILIYLGLVIWVTAGTYWAVWKMTQ